MTALSSSPPHYAIILAMAGLRRSGLFDAGHMSQCDQLMPAPGQGALALQCRRDDALTRSLLSPMDDPTTRLCVETERELVRLLDGDCHSPIAAYATMQSGKLTFQACIGASGGHPPLLRAEGVEVDNDPYRLASRIWKSLEKAGVASSLHPPTA